MSYKALYRTYRPKQFNDVVGQVNIIKTLENIIKGNKIGHAYLFSGPRGTGKTSVAHIFAKALNCEELKQFNKPCQKCVSCLLDKSNMDIIEIDAASNNGVEEIRNLIENSKYSPSNSKYKIYIIDEVHMLSKGAWNALLKTLEEPPSYAVFILATTQPHKIPITILSRVQRFNFKRIEKKYIISKTKEILKKEKITFEDDSLNLIARLADGGMRDAFSMVDQIATFNNNKITVKAITTVFGIVSVENQIKLLNYAFTKKINKMLTLLNRLVEDGIDIERLVISLIDILKDFIVLEQTKEGKLMTLLNSVQAKLLHISSVFAFKSINILSDVFSQIQYTEIPRQLLEVGLLKMLHDANGDKVKLDLEELDDKILEEDKEVETVDNISIPKTSPDKIKKIKKEVEEENVNSFSLDELEQIDEKTDIVQTLKDVVDKIENTGESDLKDKLLEEEAFAEEITEEILTSDINEETQEMQKDDIEDTETQIQNLFDFNNDTQDVNFENEYKNPKYKLEDIINLLIQGDKEENKTIKNKWDQILLYFNNKLYREYVLLLKETKLISSGENFILISCDNDKIIYDIQEINSETDFLVLIQKWLGIPKRVIAITKQEFEEAKKAYIKLSKSDSLPLPRKIKSPDIINKIKRTPKAKSEAETHGEDLFGEIFKSE